MTEFAHPLQFEEDILKWYETASNLEKLIFYRSAQELVDRLETLEKATKIFSAKIARNLLEAYRTGRINTYFAMSTIRSTLKAYADTMETK